MNKLIKSQEFDSYELDEPSDEERAVSRWATNKASGFKNCVSISMARLVSRMLSCKQTHDFMSAKR